MARKTVIKSSGVKEDTLEDADGDTKIQVEESSDEDKIRFDVDGSEKMILDGTGLGIGTSSPSTILHAYGDASNAYIATIDNDAGSSGHGLKVTTDGTGTGTTILDIEAGSTTVFKVRGDGRVGIGVATPGSTLSVDDEIAVGEKLIHRGDPDTYLMFDDDELHLAAGGRTMLKLEEGGTDKLIINHGALDIDFQVKGENAANLIRTDAELDAVGINTSSPKSTLSVAGSLAFNVTVIGSSNDPGTTYTVVATDCVILVNTRPTAQGGIDSALTITMPGVSDYPGRVVTIKDAGGYSQTNAITIQGAGSDNFEGNPSTTSIQHSSDAESITLISNGDSSWYKI